MAMGRVALKIQMVNGKVTAEVNMVSGRVMMKVQMVSGTVSTNGMMMAQARLTAVLGSKTARARAATTAGRTTRVVGTRATGAEHFMAAQT